MVVFFQSLKKVKRKIFLSGVTVKMAGGTCVRYKQVARQLFYGEAGWNQNLRSDGQGVCCRLQEDERDEGGFSGAELQGISGLCRVTTGL